MGCWHMRPLKSLPGCWVPACISVGISAEVSPGVEQHWLLPGLDPVDGFCRKGSEVEIWISDRTSSSCQGLQELSLGDQQRHLLRCHKAWSASCGALCSPRAGLQWLETLFWAAHSWQPLLVLPLSFPHPHVETFWVLKADQGLMFYSLCAKAMALFSCSFS